MSVPKYTSVIGCLLAAACTSPSGPHGVNQVAPPTVTVMCANDRMAVEVGFSTAALQSCTVTADGAVNLVVAPENDPPINCSPWYAFRLRSLDGAAHTARLRFEYSACQHRYEPKVSADLREWRRLSASAEPGSGTVYEAMVGAQPVIIAAQEVVPAATYDTWLETLAGNRKAQVQVIGESRQGRPLRALTIGNPDARKLVLVLGRQHPPEISGAKGLFAFVETLVGEDSQMAAYRDDVLTLVVPLVNPDGVEAGHWRHNAGGIDLNRDWGNYTQPETRAVRNMLEGYLAKGHKLVLLLDFHSTSRDVLYTLAEGTVTDPPELVEDWIAALHRRTPEFSFALEPGYSAGSGVAKNALFELYGIPAATVEFGDETDREVIAREGQAAALALAEVLAARP